MSRQLCPCGSRKKFPYCCEKYHLGKESPTTAEQLMRSIKAGTARSRYTAFYTGNIDYLVATLHPDKRKSDPKELAKTINNTTWLGLTIISTSKGKKQDIIGYVEFMAAFKIDESQQLHERSKFVKKDGKWFYVDGEFMSDLVPKGNDKCWCGSQKKYNKCHGK